MHAPLNCAQCLCLVLCALALAGCYSLGDPEKLWQQLLESSVASLTRSSAQSVCKACPATTTATNAVAMVNVPIDVFNENVMSFGRSIIEVEPQLHDKPVSKTQLTIFTLALIPHKVPAYNTAISALMLSEETSMRELTVQEPERHFFKLEFLEQAKRTLDPILNIRFEEACQVLLAKTISNILSNGLCDSITAVIDKKIDYYRTAFEHVSLHSDLTMLQMNEPTLNIVMPKLEIESLANAVIDAYNNLPFAIQANHEAQRRLVQESLADFNDKLHYALNLDMIVAAENPESARNVFVAFLIEHVMHQAIHAKLAFGKAKEQVIISALASLRHEPHHLLWNAPNLTGHNQKAEQLIWAAKMIKGINWLTLKKQHIAQKLRMLFHHHNVFVVRKAQLYDIISNHKSEANAVWLQYDTTVLAPLDTNPTCTVKEPASANQKTDMSFQVAPAVIKSDALASTAGTTLHACKQKMTKSKSGEKVLPNTKIVIEEPDLGTPQPLRSKTSVDHENASGFFKTTNEHRKHTNHDSKISAASNTRYVAKATPALREQSMNCQSTRLSGNETEVTTFNLGSMKRHRKNRFQRLVLNSADSGDSNAGIKPGELEAYIVPTESTQSSTEAKNPIEDLLSMTGMATPINGMTTSAKIPEPIIEKPVVKRDDSSVPAVAKQCNDLTDGLQTSLPKPLQVNDVDSSIALLTTAPTTLAGDTSCIALSQEPNDTGSTSINSAVVNGELSKAQLIFGSETSIVTDGFKTNVQTQELNPLASDCPTVAMSKVPEAPVLTNMPAKSLNGIITGTEQSKSKNSQRKKKRRMNPNKVATPTTTVGMQCTPDKPLSSESNGLNFLPASTTAHNNKSASRGTDQPDQIQNTSHDSSETLSQTPKAPPAIDSSVKITEDFHDTPMPIVVDTTSTLYLVLKRLDKSSKSYVEEKKGIVKKLDAALERLAAQRNEQLKSILIGSKHFKQQLAYLKCATSSFQASVEIKASLAKDLCVVLQKRNGMEFKNKFQSFQTLPNLSIEEFITSKQPSIGNTSLSCINMFFCCSLLNYNIDLLQEFRKLVIADTDDPVTCLAKTFTEKVKLDWDKLELDLCSDNSVGFSVPVHVPVPSTVESFINLLDQQIPSKLSQATCFNSKSLSLGNDFMSILQSSENGVYADIISYGTSVIRYENEVFETKRNRAKFLSITKVMDHAYIQRILNESMQ